ncbi:hypothetical protein HDU67_009172 [Dinochytrium kinnereticum]|nr:hypothetical protein HDU67_009172 [Dinochytrium kinnereticum]
MATESQGTLQPLADEEEETEEVDYDADIFNKYRLSVASTFAPSLARPGKNNRLSIVPPRPTEPLPTRPTIESSEVPVEAAAAGDSQSEEEESEEEVDEEEVVVEEGEEEDYFDFDGYIDEGEVAEADPDAPVCAFCEESIVEGKPVHILGRYWHLHHSRCKECRRPIGVDNFAEIDGALYCEDHYYEYRGEFRVRKSNPKKKRASYIESELAQIQTLSTVRKVRNLFNFEKSVRLNIVTLDEGTEESSEGGEPKKRPRRFVTSFMAPPGVDMSVADGSGLLKSLDPAVAAQLTGRSAAPRGPQPLGGTGRHASVVGAPRPIKQKKKSTAGKKKSGTGKSLLLTAVESPIDSFPSPELPDPTKKSAKDRRGKVTDTVTKRGFVGGPKYNCHSKPNTTKDKLDGIMAGESDSTITASPSVQNGSISAPTSMEARKLKTRQQLMEQGMIRFQDVFWGKGEDPTEGVRVVHEVFLRHLAEAEDLIALVRVRVAIEELNASRLGELGRLSGIPGSAANEVQNILMGGSNMGVGGSSSSSSGSATLGVGRRGPGGGGSNFISTGNGITSVGNQPVANTTLFNSFTALAMSVATNITSITSIASSSSPAPERSGSLITPQSPMSGPGGMGSGNISSSVHANTMGNFQSSESRDHGGAPLANDFMAFCASGANGFTEDASSLGPVIRTLREQMMAMAAVHRRHADNLTLSVLSPLTAFVDQNRRLINKKRAEVDAIYSQFIRIANDIEGRRHQYFSKTKAADDEELKFRRDGEARANPPKLGPILFGSRSIPLQEFHDIVNLLKREIKTKGILTPVGLFEGCFLGEDALALLQLKYPKSPRADIRDLCQEFVNRRCISPVIGGADGKFSASLPYGFGRPLLKTGEAPHIKARKDADIAKLEYEASIGSSESARTALEQSITEYLIAAQEAETFRLTIARGALQALEAAQIFVINEFGTSWNPRGGLHLSDSTEEDDPLLLQPPDADSGIQHIAERYRTGHLRIPPIIFESYEEGHIASQTFGVSLEDLAEVHEVTLPIVVQKCVGALANAHRQGIPHSGVDAWLSTNLEFPSIGFLRQEMNKLDPEMIRCANMKRYQPCTVSNVLRMYLLELPVSVCSFELYEPLKILYANESTDSEENEEMRLKSVKSLLKTLVPPHLETLRVLAAYFSEITKEINPSQKRFKRFFWSIAPLILRPQTETRENLADEHPWLFARDLILKTSCVLEGEIDLTKVAFFPESDMQQAEEVAVAEEAVPSEEDPAMKERRKIKKARVPVAETPKSVSSSDCSKNATKSKAESTGSGSPNPAAMKPDESGASIYVGDFPIRSASEDSSNSLKAEEKKPAPPPHPSMEYDAAAVVDSIIASMNTPPPPQTKAADWKPWSQKYTQASSIVEGEEVQVDGEIGDENPNAIPKTEESAEVDGKILEGDEFEILNEPEGMTLASIPSVISNAVESAAKALTSENSPLTAAGAATMSSTIKSVAGTMVRETTRVVKAAVARHAEAVAAAKESKTPLTTEVDEDMEVAMVNNRSSGVIEEIAEELDVDVNAKHAGEGVAPTLLTNAVDVAVDVMAAVSTGQSSEEGQAVKGVGDDNVQAAPTRATSLDVDASAVWN